MQLNILAEIAQVAVVKLFVLFTALIFLRQQKKTFKKWRQKNDQTFELIYKNKHGQAAQITEMQHALDEAWYKYRGEVLRFITRKKKI